MTRFRTSSGGRRRYLAQSRVAGAYRARFTSARAAAKWLAKQLKVKVDSLVVSTGRGRRGGRGVPFHQAPMSRFEGVIFHANRGEPRWEVREFGQVIFTTGSEKAAAVFLARRRGVEVQTLRKQQPLSKRLAQAMFRANYQVFKKYIPADYTSMVKHEINARRAMYAQETGVEAVVRE